MGEHRKLQAAKILACYGISDIFSKSEENDIEKGRKAFPDGTKSKDGKWIKQAGKWVPFKNDKGSGSEIDKKGESDFDNKYHALNERHKKELNDHVNKLNTISSEHQKKYNDALQSGASIDELNKLNNEHNEAHDKHHAELKAIHERHNNERKKLFDEYKSFKNSDGDKKGDKHEASDSSDDTKEKSSNISLEECSTVMLPTKDRSAPILAYNNAKKSGFSKPRYFPNKDWGNKDLTKHHLYIFNLNEEIKKGDWVYDKDTNKVFQVGDGRRIIGNLRKIIASTDESLKLRKDASASTKHKTLPGMSSEFIKEYCKSGGTGKVYVEYEKSSEDKGDKNPNDSDLSLKVSPDNTISIKHDS